MNLSDKQLADFQKLCKDSFDIEISKEEACEKGIKLVRLMQLVYQPITKDEYNKYK